EGPEAGVVHEDVDGVRGVAEARLHRRQPARGEEVGGAGRSRDTVRLRDLVGERGEARTVARDQHEVVAPAGEPVGEGTPEAGRRAGDQGGAHTRPSAAATPAAVASMASPTRTSAMARSGSFKPWPVTVQTATSSGESRPSADAWSSPATEAADAGSTKQPS